MVFSFVNFSVVEDTFSVVVLVLVVAGTLELSLSGVVDDSVVGVTVVEDDAEEVKLKDVETVVEVLSGLSSDLIPTVDVS